MKTLIAASTMVLMSAGAAYAQDEPMGEDPDEGSSGGSMGGGMGSTESSSAATGAGDPQMGIETSLNAVGSSPVVHLLYNLGGNYLDAGIGVSITNTSPDVGDSTTAFGLVLSGGYRMYKDMDGRIHPYLEPYLHFILANDNNDLTQNSTDIGAGAMLGVDFQVFDQFTLGAAIGGGLDFDIQSDPGKQNVLSVGVYTTSIDATFWWG